jgi:hypothetical protein
MFEIRSILNDSAQQNVPNPFRMLRLCLVYIIKIDFGETGVHQIKAMTVEFPAKFSCGVVERRKLP